MIFTGKSMVSGFDFPFFCQPIDWKKDTSYHNVISGNPLELDLEIESRNKFSCRRSSGDSSIAQMRTMVLVYYGIFPYKTGSFMGFLCRDSYSIDIPYMEHMGRDRLAFQLFRLASRQVHSGLSDMFCWGSGVLAGRVRHVHGPWNHGNTWKNLIVVFPNKKFQWGFHMLECLGWTQYQNIMEQKPIRFFTINRNCARRRGWGCLKCGASSRSKKAWWNIMHIMKVLLNRKKRIIYSNVGNSTIKI